MTLDHRLERSLVIRARPATVFAFFTNSEHWARWWGPGSTIDARPGGRMLIRHANGVEVAGEVLDVAPLERIVFTYGYASGTPIAVGASRVTIRLARHPEGTRLDLTHEFADPAARDPHVQGWRFQLSLFANVIANNGAAHLAATVDQWFVAWSDPETNTREHALDAISTPDMRFQDRYSAIVGDDEVKAHLTAVHRFMPGLRLERRGDVRHCQWQVLADWVALSADGQTRGQGTNLFVFDDDGRIAAVTGFWT